MTDGPIVVSERDRLRDALERFGGAAFEQRPDGTLACEFGGRAQFRVLPDGRVETGMALHAFEGPVDRLEVDHDRGEIRLESDHEEGTISYTFRRP